MNFTQISQQKKLTKINMTQINAVHIGLNGMYNDIILAQKDI